jgi:GABA(A) receptor-associated protein
MEFPWNNPEYFFYIIVRHYMNTYKKVVSFKTRKEETERVRRKYPNRIPCYISFKPGTKAPTLDKPKFLIPDEFKMSHVFWIIRKRMNLLDTESLFFLVNGKIHPSSSTLLKQMYTDYKDEDGMLYIEYYSENTFGCTGKY